MAHLPGRYHFRARFRPAGWDEGMRGSELYRRYYDRIDAIAARRVETPGWEMQVSSVVKQFHIETLAMARGPFRGLRDDLAADLEQRAASHPLPPSREVFALAARLVRPL